MGERRLMKRIATDKEYHEVNFFLNRESEKAKYDQVRMTDSLVLCENLWDVFPFISELQWSSLDVIRT